MTTPRDIRRPLEYWNKVISRMNEPAWGELWLTKYSEEIKESAESAIYHIQNKYASRYLGFTSSAYCRGDSLDEIKRDFVDVGMDRFIHVCGEIDKHRDDTPYPYWEDLLFYPNDVHTVYSMLCWFILFEVDPEKITRVAPYIAQAGKDRLVDTILQKYQPDREISDEDKCGRTFKLLQSVMDVDEEKAIKNLEKYLNNWGKLMGTFKGVTSLGLQVSSSVKSYETLIESAKPENKNSYYGFWAWEVALVVRHFNIDDSSFCDHEFYPKDLAHYKPGG